jgi:uncharacterized coiled-coil protein SlyX
MPSILELSRELLKSARVPPSGERGSSATAALEARVRALEENERRQAELMTTMADQLSKLTVAVTALHTQTRRLIIGQVISALVAIAALVIALRH